MDILKATSDRKTKKAGKKTISSGKKAFNRASKVSKKPRFTDRSLKDRVSRVAKDKKFRSNAADLASNLKGAGTHGYAAANKKDSHVAKVVIGAIAVAAVVAAVFTKKNKDKNKTV